MKILSAMVCMHLGVCAQILCGSLEKEPVEPLQKKKTGSSKPKVSTQFLGRFLSLNSFTSKNQSFEPLTCFPQMRSSLFFIAVLVVRVTPIPALSEPGQTADLFSNNLVISDYTDDNNNLELSFLPSSTTEDLQLIPAGAGDIDTNTDIWDLVDLGEEPDSEYPFFDNFNFDSDSSSNDDLLVSSEPFQNPDIKFGGLDEYISDPFAKCPLDDYRQAACCGELLSENRFIPNCAPSKNRKSFCFSLPLLLFWFLSYFILTILLK